MRFRSLLVRGGVIAALLVTLVAPGMEQAHASPVDLHYSEDVSSGIDGKPARISLHVHGRDFKAPFSWSLRVEGDGRLLYSASGEDGWHDAFFADDGYLEGCTGYEECKRLWYYDQLPAQLKRAVGMKQAPEGSIDPLNREMAVPIVAAFLERKGLNAAGREAVLAEVSQLWQQGFVSLEVPLSPMVSWHLMYVPSLGSFVPYQRDPHSDEGDYP